MDDLLSEGQAWGDPNVFVSARAFPKWLSIKTHAFWAKVATGFAVLKTLNTELPEDPPVPLLGVIYTKKFENRRSNESLHTNACGSTIHLGQKVQKPQCPATGEWITNKWYVHTVEYYSALKKE